MKVSFALTLDGMLRALRTKLHGAQDETLDGVPVDGRGRATRHMDDEAREERDGGRRG